MRRCWAFWIVGLLAFSACGNKGEIPKPDHFLTEQQMIDVLADSYLIEADLNQRKTAGEDVTAFQNAYYEQLFEHYGITDSIFDENMYYYTHHPDILERIMDSVTDRFAKAKK